MENVIIYFWRVQMLNYKFSFVKTERETFKRDFSLLIESFHWIHGGFIIVNQTMLCICQQISTYDEVIDEWYLIKKKLIVVNATCWYMSSKRYIKYLANAKRTRTKLWKVIKKPSQVYFLNSSNPQITLIPMHIHHYVTI